MIFARSLQAKAARALQNALLRQSIAAGISMETTLQRATASAADIAVLVSDVGASCSLQQQESARAWLQTMGGRIHRVAISERRAKIKCAMATLSRTIRRAYGSPAAHHRTVSKRRLLQLNSQRTTRKQPRVGLRRSLPMHYPSGVEAAIGRLPLPDATSMAQAPSMRAGHMAGTKLTMEPVAFGGRRAQRPLREVLEGASYGKQVSVSRAARARIRSCLDRIDGWAILPRSDLEKEGLEGSMRVDRLHAVTCSPSSRQVAAFMKRLPSGRRVLIIRELSWVQVALAFGFPAESQLMRALGKQPEHALPIIGQAIAFDSAAAVLAWVRQKLGATGPIRFADVLAGISVPAALLDLGDEYVFSAEAVARTLVAHASAHGDRVLHVFDYAHTEANVTAMVAFGEIDIFWWGMRCSPMSRAQRRSWESEDRRDEAERWLQELCATFQYVCCIWFVGRRINGSSAGY